EWAVEFGDIGANSWARGYWITRCNMDATVTGFEAELEHLPFKGVQLNPLITDVHTEIILGDFLFADAIDPNNSFSLIDRDDNGIPDYLINLYTGLRQEIIVPSELNVSEVPTIEAPQMTFSIPATNGFVCMVLNDPLVQINIRGIQRHHLDGSGDIYELSGNNFWRDGETLYIVDRIGEIVDGQPANMPVEYVIDYQSALEVRKLELGSLVFNTLMADGNLREFQYTHWFEDYRDDDDFGVTEYGLLSGGLPPEKVPLYNSPLPIIAGDTGWVRVEFYNGGVSPESGDIGVYLIDDQGIETLVASNRIDELRSYRTEEIELPFDTTDDGAYTLAVRFLDGRTEGNASKQFRINARPVSDAGTDRTVKLGEPVHFDSARSYDPDGILVNYQWYMDDQKLAADGKTVTGGKWIAGPVRSYTFDDSGTFDVLLVTSDYDGAMEEDKMLVTVEETRPDLYIASFGHGQPQVLDGQPLTVSVEIGNAAEDLPPAADFYVSLYAGEQLVESRRVTGGLPAGQLRTINFSYIASLNVPFLSVVIDDLGSLVNEANERNNADTLAIFADQVVFADLVTQNVRLNVGATQPVGWG
ncbi:MAG TPA: PKD domain-containing protein, partial [Tichowtungia sp.]|nr:PKD domain-containing protein [Tichowtungia sp.]